jgi:hypothetical protein
MKVWHMRMISLGWQLMSLLRKHLWKASENCKAFFWNASLHHALRDCTRHLRKKMQANIFLVCLCVRERWRKTKLEIFVLCLGISNKPFEAVFSSMRTFASQYLDFPMEMFGIFSVLILLQRYVFALLIMHWFALLLTMYPLIHLIPLWINPHTTLLNCVDRSKDYTY